MTKRRRSIEQWINDWCEKWRKLSAPIEKMLLCFLVYLFILAAMHHCLIFPFFFKQDFTTDFYFRQYWKDPRLSFDRLPGIERIMVSTEYLKNIWVPDTFFANEKSSYMHMATTSNEFLRISHAGEINRSIRLGHHHRDILLCLFLITSFCCCESSNSDWLSLLRARWICSISPWTGNSVTLRLKAVS